jgi:hypothetical protein
LARGVAIENRAPSSTRKIPEAAGSLGWCGSV